MVLDDLDEDRTSSVILVTDGVANIGSVHHADFLNLVAEKDIRLFTFVIGNSGNRPLLDSLAKASGGFAMDISEYDDIYGRILQAKNKVFHEAMHGVQVKIQGGNIKDLSPATPGSLYRGQQLVMFGRYEKAGPVSVTLNAKISGNDKTWHCNAVLPAENTDNPEIERLWALSVIEELMDEVRVNGESEKLRKKIVDLARKYSLVTDYTSMLVLDEQEMESSGIQHTGITNAARVKKERKARAKRRAVPVKSYRVDSKPGESMFNGAESSAIGSGPAGPWFLLILFLGCWILKRKE
jgi:Ca-activated chloride channel family protein